MEPRQLARPVMDGPVEPVSLDGKDGGRQRVLVVGIMRVIAPDRQALSSRIAECRQWIPGREALGHQIVAAYLARSGRVRYDLRLVYHVRVDEMVRMEGRRLDLRHRAAGPRELDAEEGRARRRGLSALRIWWETGPRPCPPWIARGRPWRER